MRIHALALPALLGLAGCSTTPGWDGVLGDSVRQARAQQIIDPGATNRPMAQGIDGKAAAGAQRTYAESYGYTLRESRPAVLVLPTGAAASR